MMSARNPKAQEEEKGQQKTSFDTLIATTEHQPLCSCGRGEKVLYACTRTDCPNYKKQPMYCELCLDDDPGPHEHKPKPIHIKNTSIKTNWSDIRQDSAVKVDIVNAWKTTHKDLLQILAKELPDGKLHHQLQKVLELDDQINKYYQTVVADNEAAEDMLKL